MGSFVTQRQFLVYLKVTVGAQTVSSIRYASSKSSLGSRHSTDTKLDNPKKGVLFPSHTTVQPADMAHKPVIQRSRGTTVTPSLGEAKSTSRGKFASKSSRPYYAPIRVHSASKTAIWTNPLLESHDYVFTPGDTQVFQLPDGRQLGYAIYGSRSNRAQKVLEYHGTPGSRLNLAGLDTWGRQNNITFICPERPGYALSTFTKTYTVLEHARDVHDLMDHLGHHQYKVRGTSGGGGYALASTYLASLSHHTVTGTVLVAPSSPPEAPRIGQHFTTFLFNIQAFLFPSFAERSHRKDHDNALGRFAGPQDPDAVLRRKHEDRIYLVNREQHRNVDAFVYDKKATNSYWGFELRDVAAQRIVIFAGGLDVNTPLSGTRWMRNRLGNCELQVYAEENHRSLQTRHRSLINDFLKNM